MSISLNRRKGRIGPSYTGRLIEDTYRGVIRVRSWPRPAGPRQTAHQKQLQERFRVAIWATKFMTAREQKIAQAVTAGTPLMPRDLLLMALYARMFAIKLEDGRYLMPKPFRADVSEALDVLGQSLGELLLRGDDFWEALAPGPSGHVLTSNGPGTKPTYEPPAGGGRGATVIKASNQVVSAGAFQFTYQTVLLDDAGLWDGANNQFVIPAGFSRARITLNTWNTSAGSDTAEAPTIRKNGADFVASHIQSGIVFRHSLVSGLIPVAQGDTFQAWGGLGAGVRTFNAGNWNAFSIEVF